MLTPIMIFPNEFLRYLYKNTYLPETDARKTFKTAQKIKIKSSHVTCKRSHGNITDKRKNDNRFSEHFRLKFSSQDTRKGCSKDQNFRSFLGEHAPRSHLAALPFGTRLIPWLQKISRFYILKTLGSLRIQSKLSLRPLS